MASGNFRPSGPLSAQCFVDEAARLRLQRLNVPQPTERSNSASPSVASVYEQLKQVDWSITLEGTENFKNIIGFSNEIAKRGAGLMAFQRKYYGVLFNNLTKNRAGDLRGVVVSAKWRGYFDNLGKLGKIFNLAGIPLEAAELSWTDLSAKGISANLMTATARWVAEKPLLVPQVIQGATQRAGWTAEKFGFKETANELDLFSERLEGSISYLQRVIDNTFSVANARDVLTWDRSVVNPRNWSLLKEAVQSCFEERAAETPALRDAVAETIWEWCYRRP